MVGFDAFIDEFKEEVVNQAKISFSDCPDAAVTDTYDAVNAVKNELKRWTTKMSQGSLTQDGFVALASAKKDKMEFKNLSQTAVDPARTEQFRQYLISLLINRIIENFA